MKENKKIDNRMKAKKLAAYTLATCMTVTVAPIGAVTPIMAEEVSTEMYAAATPVSITKDAKFEIKNNITAGMKYKDAYNKITATDVSTNSVGTLVSNYISISDEDGEIYNSNDNTTRENDKFEVGKKYKIEATFELNGYDITADGVGTIPTTDGKTTLTGVNDTDSLTLTTYTIDMTKSSTTLKVDEYVDSQGDLYLRNEKGVIQDSVTTVAHQASTGDWLYIKDGKVTDAEGDTVVDNANGKWLIKDGEHSVDFDDTDKVVVADGDGVLWYFTGGKAQTGVTDIVEMTDANKYNIVAGKVQKKETVAHEKTTGKWLYIGEDGKVGAETGFYKNDNGTWYVTAGEVKFTDNGLQLNDDDNKTYFLKNSKVDTTKNGTVFDAGVGVKVVKNGVVDASAKLPAATVAHDPDTGKWYAVDKDGAIDVSSSLAKNENGTWVVDDNGEVQFDAWGLIQDKNAVISSDTSKIYFVEGGKVNFKKTGFVVYTHNGMGTGNTITDDDVDGFFYVENGVVTGKKFGNSVIHNPEDGNWYNVQEDGTVGGPDGLAKNAYGTWVIEGGRVNFKAEGFYQYTDTDIDESVYYVKDGKVQTGKTGWVIIDDSGDGKLDTSDDTYCYVVNGKVSNPAKTTVEQAPDGKWLVADAKAAGDDGKNGAFEGIVTNAYGTWYVEAGEVAFDVNGLKVDANNDLGKGSTKEYLFEKSKLITNKTGLVDVDGDGDDTNAGDLKYFENGVITGKSATNSVVHYAPTGDWYSIDADGEVDAGNNGLAANANGIWKLTTGKVDFTYENFYEVQAADVKIGKVTKGDELYFKGGKFQSNVTGLITIGATSKYVKNGVVTTTGVNDIVQASNGNWYLLKDGEIQDTFTGIAENANGKWYLEAGMVNFNKTGVVYADASDYDKGEYYVENGQMKGNKNGIISVGTQKYLVKDSKLVTDTELKNSVVNGNDGKWYYVDADGNVDVTYTDKFAGNENGVWYITDGAVDFDKTGVVTGVSTTVPSYGTRVALDGDKANTGAYFVKGKWQSDFSGVVVDGSNYYTIEKGYVVTGPTKVTVLTAIDGKQYAVKGDALVTDKVVAEYTTTAGDKKLLYCENGKPAKVTGVKTGVTLADGTTTGQTVVVESGVVITDKDDYTAPNGTKYDIDADGVATEV